MSTSWLRWFRVAVIVCLSALVWLPASRACADSPAADVRSALWALEEWLGPTTYGQGWREFLHLEQLKAELAEGHPAGGEQLAAVESRLSSGAAGLNMPRFAALKAAINAWSRELPPWSLDELPAAVRAAKDHFVPTTAEDVARAKRELAAAVAHMNRQLDAGGQRGRGWAEYLMRDALRAQLEAEQPDLDVLDTIHDRFVGHYEGLEIPWLLDVRMALRRYADRVAALDNADARAAYESLIELLAATLEKHAADPTPENRELIAYIVGQFERYAMAPEIARAVQHYYSRPNLFLHASAPVIASGIARPVDDITPVRDVILGTSIYGTGHTRGDIYVEMVPHPNRALLDVMLRGTTASNTVGYNGPVQLYTTGLTSVSGRKRLVIDASGVRGLPATAAARTSTHVNGLSTNKHGLIDRIIRKAAWKQVWQKKSQSEYIGSRRAEGRIRSRMNRESAGFIADADRGFQERFISPLLRFDVYPEQLRFYTTPRHLHVVSLQSGVARLGAPGGPPPITSEGDLAVRVHESMGNNLAKDLLGGLTLTQTRVREIALNLQDDPNEKLPDWLVIDEEKGPWSITFEAENVELGTRPLTVRFADGGFRVTIHGTSYVVDGIRHNTKMDITAIYRFENTDAGWRGLRQGKPQIFPPGFDPEGNQTLSVQETALKGNMENRFDDIFEAEFEMENFRLPGQWADAGVFHLTQVESRDGWLALAWRRADEPGEPAEIRSASVPAETKQ